MKNPIEQKSDLGSINIHGGILPDLIVVTSTCYRSHRDQLFSGEIIDDGRKAQLNSGMVSHEWKDKGYCCRTWLGLRITRGIIEVHGGRIYMESED